MRLRQRLFFLGSLAVGVVLGLFVSIGDLNLLIACSEAMPYAKTGGLADVTGALLKEFRKERMNASLILPLYAVIKQRFKPVRTGKIVTVPMGNFEIEGAIWTADKGKHPEALFIECDAFFARPELYGTGEGDYTDNALRYILLLKGGSRSVPCLRHVAGYHPLQ